MKAITFLIVTLGLAGCATNVTVEGRVPTPLVAEIPATVGVHYSENFRSFRHEEVIEQRGTWRVDLGKQNLEFFRNLFNAMFDSVKEIEELPATEAQVRGLDGLIVPRIVKYGFLTPGISGLNFYSASIEYEISLYDREGNKLGAWNVVGYGKSEAGVFGHGEALGNATMLAIRDGGARIAIELPDQPFVAQWLDMDENASASESAEQKEGGGTGLNEEQSSRQEERR